MRGFKPASRHPSLAMHPDKDMLLKLVTLLRPGSYIAAITGLYQHTYTFACVWVIIIPISISHDTLSFMPRTCGCSINESTSNLTYLGLA